jgi:hypothetical protein
MPLSPLNRFLIALTLLAFAAVFRTMMTPDSWLAPGSLAVALALWTAALFGLVKSGATFDERAFHPTRPDGRRRAFLRSASWMLLVVTSVSLMAVIRGWHFHLGWRAIWAGGLIVFVLMCLFTAAVATGFNLSFSRARNTRWVAWLIVGLPLATHIALVENKRGAMWPGARVFESWTLNLNPGVVCAALGFGLAWWLSAGRGRWRASLALGAMAGVSLPLLVNQGPLLGRERKPLPDAALRIERRIIDNPEPVAGGSVVQVAELDPRDFLKISGLRDDEFLHGNGRAPRRIRVGNRDGSESWMEDPYFRLIWWNSMDADDSTRRNEAFMAAGMLPDPPAVKSSYYGKFNDRFSFHPSHVGAAIRRLNAEDWLIQGVVRRIEHEGSFPLFEGGVIPLRTTGQARISPANREPSGLLVNYLQILPAPRFHPSGHESQSGEELWQPAGFILLIVNRSETRAIDGAPRDGRQGRLLASEWRSHGIRFDDQSFAQWPQDELEGARVHLFTSQPVSRVRMTVPPPDR